MSTRTDFAPVDQKTANRLDDGRTQSACEAAGALQSEFPCPLDGHVDITTVVFDDAVRQRKARARCRAFALVE